MYILADVYFSRDTSFYDVYHFRVQKLGTIPITTHHFCLRHAFNNRYLRHVTFFQPKYEIFMFYLQEEPIPENLNHVMTDVEVAQSVEQAIAALDIVS